MTEHDETWDLVSTQEWFVVQNDLVGGWAVANAALPLSQLEYSKGQTGIADFLSRVAANHIVRLHNLSLEVTDGAT